MVSKHFIIATAGHVDHGKSSLVRALTGTDPDRLPEEKARGITIDLGFAYLDLPDPKQPGSSCRLGIVDVPGHEDFVKNMAAGVGAVDVALLVVAADDGWMPQTEEHLQILDYLRVKQGVVALTKIDLAAHPEPELVEGVAVRLQGSSLAGAPIVPVSTVDGRGLDELVRQLSAIVAKTTPALDAGKPRLAVDRAFVLHGIGTVVTGTLAGGTLRRGQPVFIQPWGGRGKIRTIQSHGQESETAVQATRTALNLPDLSLAGPGAKGIQRGDIVTIEELGGAVDAVEVLVEKSPRPQGEKGAARPIKDGTRLRWHYTSANVPARIRLYETKEIRPGEKQFAQLRFESPVFVLAGERFILRDWAGQFTLAGGLVLEAQPRPRSTPFTRHLEFLRQRQTAPDALTVLQAQLGRDHLLKQAEALVKTTFSFAEVRSAIAGALEQKRAVLSGGLLIDPEWWQELEKKASGWIDDAHRQNPEKTGLPLGALRQQLAAIHSSPELFDSLVSRLTATGFQQSGTFIRRAAHRQALPPHLEAAGKRVHAALSAKPLEPPSRKEAAPDLISQQALRFFIDTGQVVELGPDVVMLSENYQRAARLVRAFIQENGPATVSQLRQALGATRRIVVPLLERLDREGITRREGDARVLRPPPQRP